MTRLRHIVVALLLDLGALGCALAALVGVATAGVDVRWGGIEVSLHSPHNPVVGFVLLTCARALLRTPGPFLAVPGWNFTSADPFWWRTWVAVRQRLAVVTDRQGLTLVCALGLVTLAVKLWNAFRHEGFFSGDDVEIHEMTLGVLWKRDWPVTPLRSAFYPLVFVYPGQALASALGVRDVETMVAVGRGMVAVVSTMTPVLLWAVARARYGMPIAMLAAVALAGSHLDVAFGGTELPRPVATLFVLGAFGALQRQTARMAVAAGLLLAVGAAMRFSEVVFLVPAAIQLVAERRHRAAVVCLATAAGAFVAIQVVSDLWYWNAPLHSARAIVQFTLIEGGSTRGYEPAWRYLETVNAWTDPLVFALALWTTRKAHWREAVWLWTPILVLSLLPHKESRYLIPVTPYLSLLAAIGGWRLIQRAAAPGWTRRLQLLRIGLITSMAGAVLINVSGYRVSRTDAEVDLGREIGRLAPGVGVAVEQLWRLGGRLYLGARPVVDLESLADPFAALSNADIRVLVLPADRCEAWSCDRLLQSGWAERATDASRNANYRVFHRRP